MGVFAETPEEMVNIIEKTLSLSVTDIEDEYNTTIYNERIKINLGWIDCLTPVEITATDSQVIEFRCTMDADCSLLAHQKATTAFETAAKAFCEEKGAKPTEYFDVLSANPNTTEGKLSYEMKYNTKYEQLNPVPSVLSELSDAAETQ